MLRYILQRILWSIVTLWAVVTLTFIIMHSIPGNPFAKEGNMPPGVYENLMKYYHLNEPLYKQYFIYLNQLLHLDFGPSIKSDVMTVNRMIQDGFPISLQLGTEAMIFAVFFGIIFGVIAALGHNRYPDYISMVLAIIGISVPSFILASVFINYLAVEWNLFPPARWGTWKHTVLPSLSLAAMPMAFIARLMRSSTLEVLSQDYIKTAKAKGLAKSMVIIRHSIRNAILPVVTVLGVLTANTITGSFVIEHIFGIPGIGELFVKGIFNRDYPVILGSTVFYSSILILLLLLVDISYSFIDPRIRLTGGEKS